MTKTITILLLFNAVAFINELMAQAFEGLNVGINCGFDFREKYVDQAIADRYVRFEKRLGLSIGYSAKYEKIALNFSLNPYMSLARIHPYILSNLDPGPQNRKDYFGLKTDINAYLGKGFIKPVVGFSVGVIPQYPYEIRNYLKNTTTSLEWGLIGGLATVIDERNVLNFGCYY